MNLDQALERIAELEDQLAHCIYARSHDVAQIQRGLSVSASQAYILSALYRAGSHPLNTVDLDTLVPQVWCHFGNRQDQEFRAAKTIEVHLSRIRQQIGRDKIQNIHSTGYVLTPAGREMIEKALHAA